MTRYFPLLVAFILLCLCPFSQAKAGDSVRSPRAEVRLVSELDAVQAGQEFWVGWHFRLSPKWHTYWKNPGDSGEAMRVRWKENPGYRVGPLQYPAPKRIEMPPLANFGYSGEVLILARVQAGPGLRPGDELKLVAEATWLVCEEECIPEKGEFELTLPVRAKAEASETWGKILPSAAQALPKPWPAGASLFREQDSPQWNLKISGG